MFQGLTTDVLFALLLNLLLAAPVAPVGAQDSGQTVWECVYVCVIV